MAAAVSLSAQRQEDFKEEFLTCSLCFEPYDNGKHQAKCLPCLHTYCKNCLKRHGGERPKFNCPKCRYLVVLPDETVDSLPNNFLVENLKEYRDLFNFALLCGSCENEGNQAVSFCHDCGCFLCQGCIEAHRRLGPLRMHKLSTISELQEKKCNPLSQQHQQCKKHPKHDLTLFCKDTKCKVPLCATCGLVDHRTHELVDITSAVDEIVEDMRKSSAIVTARNQELAKERVATETVQKTLMDNFNKKVKEMKACVQELHKEIDDRYDKAHSQLKQMYDAEMESLTANIDSINLLSDQMTNASEFASQACIGNQAMQVLSSQTQILKRLDELATVELPKTTSDKTDFALTDKHHAAMAQMKTSLQDLCDADWLNLTPEAVEPQKKLQPQIKPIYCTCTLEDSYFCFDAFEGTVQAVDTSGQLMTTGSAEITVWQELDKNIYVTDNNNGTYSFTVYSYNGDEVHVNINGTSIRRSPFNLSEYYSQASCSDILN